MKFCRCGTLEVARVKRSAVAETEGRFLFVAGSLCIDFVNLEVMDGGERVDLLPDFDALVDWLEAAGALGDDEATAARKRWGGTREGSRRERAKVFARAVALRAALRRMVGRLAEGRTVERASIAAINEVLREPVRYWQVRARNGAFEEVPAWDLSSPGHLLAPVADSARELLCSRDPSLVRRCRNENCILYFYDATKNHARAWCSMSLCGNRTKVAAHYRRRRG